MKKWISLLIALLLCLTLSACSGSKNAGFTADSVSPGEAAIAEDMSTSISAPVTDRKLIYRATVHAETKEFDQSKEQLDALIQKYNGYVETSSLSGSAFGHEKGTRWLEYTLRVPAESLFAFLEDFEQAARVLSTDTDMDDVTTAYVDTEARLNALRHEEERLLALLDQAANLTEVLEIEDRLSKVRYEIESMTAQLKVYDNEVAYSTVTIYLNDVTDYSVQVSFGSRSFDAFVGGWNGFVDAMQSLVIGLLRLWPFLVIALIIVVLIVVCTKRSAKKKRAAFQNAFPPAAPSAESQKETEKEE